MISRAVEISSFIKKLIGSPKEIGAVMPSGKNLCRAMVEAIGIDREEIYVEVGAGTGVVTEQAIRAGIPPENIYVFENDEGFRAELEEKFPDCHVIIGDAQILQKHLTERGVGKVSKVISSLPFKSLPKEVGANILEQFDMILKEDGKIVQFTYAMTEPYPQSFKEHSGFHARHCKYIKKNVPPANVWCYERNR